MAHQQFERVSPVGAFAYQYISAPASVDTEVGLAGRGTFVDSILVGQPGASAVLTLKNGSDVVGVFDLSASMPVIPLHLACDAGLYYQLSGSGSISLTVVFLDYVLLG